MSFTGPCLGLGFPAMVWLGWGWNIYGQGLRGGLWVVGGMSLQGIVGPHALPSCESGQALLHHVSGHQGLQPSVPDGHCVVTGAVALNSMGDSQATFTGASCSQDAWYSFSIAFVDRNPGTKMM